MKLYKKIFSVIFLLMLFPFSIVNVIMERDNIERKIISFELPEKASDVRFYISQIDGTLTDKLAGDHWWNELYGGVYRWLGKNEENAFKYVRDKNGFLYSGNFYNNSDVGADELAGRVRRMQESLPEDTKLLVLMYPTKYNQLWSDGYYGIPYNNLDEYADDVLRYFRRYDIDYMDYREIFRNADMTMEDIFYRTDHHWTVPTAFFATGKLIEHLNEKYDANLDPGLYYRDINNYYTETHEDVYMGSQGRDTGEIYAGGLDDYTYIYPKFDTYYTYSFRYRSGERGEKSGETMKSLIDKKYLGYHDVYTREMNNSYLQGIVLTDQIKNKLLKEGEGPKLLFIRDSYSSPVGVFMAPMCTDIDMLWSLHFKNDSVEKALSSKHYDYVIVAFAIDNFKDEAFPFFLEEKKTAGKAEGGE
ncbi:MAG: alginate O-acetyltransferase AlgX-related protein [Stomatobaculum sp.]